MTYKLKVTVFDGTDMQYSAQGKITLLDTKGKGIENRMFNDWVEIGVIIRELLAKHKKKITILDSQNNPVGDKLTHRRKKRMVD